MKSESFLKNLDSVSTSNSGKPMNLRSNASVKKEVAIKEHKPNEMSADDVETWKKLFE